MLIGCELGGGGGKGREDTDTAIRGSSRLGSWCMFSSDLRQGSGQGKEEAAPSNAVLGPIRTCHDPTPHQSPDQARAKLKVGWPRFRPWLPESWMQPEMEQRRGFKEIWGRY